MRRVLTKKEVEMLNPQQVHELLSSVMLADGFDLVVDLEQSYSVNIFDCKHKRWYLDFFSYFASAPLSHNHPKMKDEAFLNKLLRVAQTKPSNSDVYTVEFAQFVATFVRVLMPEEFRYLFFIDGGALAVENALKTAFDWKTRLLGKQEELDLGVLHFKEAFHGRTGYTLSLTNTADPRKYVYFTKFHWHRFDIPPLRFPISESVLNEVKAKECAILEEMESVLKYEKDRTAAIIIEPIQAEGGDNHFRGEFLKGLRELADKYEVMLIFDEVQTGCGLTGKRWAYEHFGVVPDIVAFGKKTQVCGIMVTERVDKVSDNVFHTPSRLNSTWGGNLTDMVRAQRYLEIIEEDNLVENARIMGTYLLEGLQELQAKYPALISNARGRGLMCAFDAPSHEMRNKLLKEIQNQGLLLLPCGDHSIRFRPYLDVSKDHIDKAIALIDAACKAIQG